METFMILCTKKMHSEERIVELAFDLPVDAVDIVLPIAGGGRILRKKRIAHRDLKGYQHSSQM